MTISMILAWLTVICAVLAAFKYIARISKNRALNQFFHKIHIPFGALMLVFGLLHGLLAGNPSFATLSSFTLAPELFTLNWGTACLVLGILLALTYLFRRRLKKKWMPAHRALTVALIVCLALHLLNVGIQLPGRLFGSSETASVSQSAAAAPRYRRQCRDGYYDGCHNQYHDRYHDQYHDKYHNRYHDRYRRLLR
jgi:chromate transport protein ChrA